VPVKAKICSKCKTEHPATLGYFGPDMRASDYLQSCCRSCKRIADKKYRQTHNGRLAHNKGNRRYAKTPKGKITGKQKERKYRKTDKGKKTVRKIKRNARIESYGITVEQYDMMLLNQNGVCAICGRPELNRRLCIDHNHTTGEVRGLLCTSCNVFVGYLEKDDGLRQKAKEYLGKYVK